MIRMKALLGTAAALGLMAAGPATAQIELTTNGGFEAGFTSENQIFDGVTNPLGNSGLVSITNDAFEGTQAALITNTDDSGAASILKIANVGVGVVQPNSTVDVSFYAKGSGAAGGVAFAEFFSELSGGGTSLSELLNGAPLTLTDEYQLFTFNGVVTGSDVSGGVTLQFNAATGAVPGSASELFVDNVSISVIPEPTSMILMGLGGLAALGGRRRRKA